MTSPRTTPDPLAPHVDRAWLDAFVVELRLRDVPGARIGDALAEVDAHCVDSGEEAAAAFGDPVAYARSLDLPPVAGAAGEVRRVVAAVAIQLAGLLLLPATAAAVARGAEVAIAGGTLLASVLAIAAVSGLAVAPSGALRVVLGRPVVAWAGLTAITAAVALPAVLWRSASVHLGPGVVAVVALAALATGTVIGWRALGAEDPVRAPDPAGSPTGARATRARTARAVTTAPLLLVPAATALLTAASWLAAR
jgi:uncharacterized membrane protein